MRLRRLRGLGIAERGARLVPRQAGALDDVAQIDVLGDVARLRPDAAHRRARERERLGRPRCSAQCAIARQLSTPGAERIAQLAERDAEPVGFALGVAHDVQRLTVGTGRPRVTIGAIGRSTSGTPYGARTASICSSARYEYGERNENHISQVSGLSESFERTALGLGARRARRARRRVPRSRASAASR